MNALLRFSAAALLALLLIVISGCGTTKSKQISTEFHEVTIASASSMQPALSEIAPAFEEETGYQAQLVYGSSGLLARQIENRAPYDVFLSADKGLVTELSNQGRLAEGRPYAQGTIVLIGKAMSLKGLADPSIKNIAIANPEIAPYGAAAKQAMENAGVWADVQDKIVFSENVAQTYDFVATKNADAGIVALSLVITAKTDYSRIKQSLYDPIEQWGAIVSGAESTETAREFLKHLEREETKEILETYGFEPVGAAKQ